MTLFFSLMMVGIIGASIVIAQVSSPVETIGFYVFGVLVLVISQFFGRLFLSYRLGNGALEVVYMNLRIASVPYGNISNVQALERSAKQVHMALNIRNRVGAKRMVLVEKSPA